MDFYCSNCSETGKDQNGKPCKKCDSYTLIQLEAVYLTEPFERDYEAFEEEVEEETPVILTRPASSQRPRKGG